MKNQEKENKRQESEKRKARGPLNKKRRNNKVLRAKEILNNNKVAKNIELKKEKTDRISSPRKTLRIVKNTVFLLLFIVLGLTMLTFIIVRMNGGTPSVFGYSVQRITSGSMEPALSVGDIILSKEVKSPDDIQVDDIITFKGGSYFDYNSVTHRVVIPPMKNEGGIYMLTTHGDANDNLDPEIEFSSVEFKYINKVDFLRRFYDFFLSPWGLIVFIAALLVIFFDELLTVVKVVSGNYHEEDDEDENLNEIMERLKREEEEEMIRLETEKERKRRIYQKYGSTSKKKQKAQKKQIMQNKKLKRSLEAHGQSVENNDGN